MDRFVVARLGKTVGLKGELRLQVMSDFTEQFAPGNRFDSDRGPLEIAAFYPNKSTVVFQGYEDIDSAKPLTNAYLYSDEEATRANCTLEEGEMFWFDMIGLEVIEDEKVLGKVVEIDRIGEIEYFRVKTDKQFSDYAKAFLIPNIDVYIKDKNSGGIFTEGALDVLKES
ncbi:MAG: ribosome maturation factor RimM [Campylobacterota bacterium]